MDSMIWAPLKCGVIDGTILSRRKGAGTRRNQSPGKRDSRSPAIVKSPLLSAFRDVQKEIIARSIISRHRRCASIIEPACENTQTAHGRNRRVLRYKVIVPSSTLLLYPVEDQRCGGSTNRSPSHVLGECHKTQFPMHPTLHLM